MTKKEFRDWLNSEIVFLDGATGSNLQKRGMPTGVCPELWITEHPDVITGLQQEYVAAGSNIVYASTFSGNRIKMTEYGLADRLTEINTKLVEITRAAVDKKALVAADITMTGAQLEPMGDLTFAELVDVYKEQLEIITSAGVDVVGIETMMSLQETRAAVLAATEVCPDMPLFATLSFTESGNTLYGASAESAVVVLQEMGVDAVGLNCSAGPDKMLPIVKRMKAVANIPVIAKPNAGLPQVDSEGKTYYDMKPEEFAGYMTELVKAGANLIGGCCGTDPDYIRRTKEAVCELSSVPSEEKDVLYLADQRSVYPFEVGQELELGDGIDFTKDEELQEDARDEIFDGAVDVAFDLQDEEADALLFVAEGLEDEAELLKNAINDVTGVVRMPVVVASSDPDTVAAVLREYNGIAAVMCLSQEEKVLCEMEKVRNKYHALSVSVDKKIGRC